jgi:hypothetical protein
VSLTTSQPYDTIEVATDPDGHEMPFVVRPGTNPEECRTLVVLHGHGANTVPSKFVSPDWNVIVPFDRYGYQGLGSWWLGEDGKFFVADLLQQVVEETRERFGGDRGLYFWGSSMGGYGAILQGLLMEADAVFAHIPQTRLRGTQYTERPTQRTFLDPVLGDSRHAWIDLASLLAEFEPRRAPLFFLSQNRFDYPKYLEQHCLHFVNACIRGGFNFHLEVQPKQGHKLYTNVARTVALFDRFHDDIAAWKAPAE